jgi:hypothetical protein
VILFFLKSLYKFSEILGLFLLLLSSAAIAKGGSMDSGGGSSLLLKNGRVVLYELATNEHISSLSQLTSRQNDEFYSELKLASRSSVFKKPNGEILYTNLIKIEEQKAYSLLMIKLDQWRPQSPAFIELLESAIKGQKLFSKFRIDKKNPRNLPNLYEEQINFVDKIEYAALYYKELDGAVISEKIWNAMDGESQAGLLLRESLRHIQWFSLNKNSYFDTLPFANSGLDAAGFAISDLGMDYIVNLIMRETPDNSLDIGTDIEKGVLIEYFQNARKWVSLLSEICYLQSEINQLIKSSSLLEMHSKTCGSRIKPEERLERLSSNWFFVMHNYYNWMSESKSEIEARLIEKLFRKSEATFLEVFLTDFNPRLQKMRKLNP